MSGGEVIGNGTSLRLDVSPPLTVNTINRTVYWYRGDLAEPVLMQQPLDGGEPEVCTWPGQSFSLTKYPYVKYA